MIISGQFNDSLPPIMDGVAIAAINYSYWLTKKYAPSYAIGPRIDGEVNSEPGLIRYMSLPLQRQGPYRLGLPHVDRSFSKLIDEVPFDIVHAHCPFISGNYALSIAKNRNIPLVATFHSKYRDDLLKALPLEAPVNYAVKKIVEFYDQADAVWVPNEAIIDTLRDYGFKGKVDYVPNGSDMRAESSSEREKLKQLGREFLNLNGPEPVLLYVGQLRWIKNLRRTLEALKILHEHGQAFQMRFVGTGPDEDEMKKLVKTYGMSQKVGFPGAVYDRDKLKQIYAAADVFVFPSLYDNASLATREAAGLYVPTLFAKNATTAWGIRDCEDGFLADDDSKAFADKLQYILSDESILNNTGAGAHNSLYKSWESIADTVYEKYEELIYTYKKSKTTRLFPLKQLTHIP